MAQQSWKSANRVEAIHVVAFQYTDIITQIFSERMHSDFPANVHFEVTNDLRKQIGL